MHASKLRRLKAFTLVEIMVTLFVFTLAMGVILPFITQAFKSVYAYLDQSAHFNQVTFAYKQMQTDAATANYVYVLKDKSQANSLEMPDVASVPFLKSNQSGDVLIMIQTNNVGVGGNFGRIVAFETIRQIFVYFLEPQPGYPGFYNLYRYGFDTNVSMGSTQTMSTAASGAKLLLSNVVKITTTPNQTNSAEGGFICAVLGKGAAVRLLSYTKPFIFGNPNTLDAKSIGCMPLQCEVVTHL